MKTSGFKTQGCFTPKDMARQSQELERATQAALEQETPAEPFVRFRVPAQTKAVNGTQLDIDTPQQPVNQAQYYTDGKRVTVPSPGWYRVFGQFRVKSTSAVDGARLDMNLYAGSSGFASAIGYRFSTNTAQSFTLHPDGIVFIQDPTQETIVAQYGTDADAIQSDGHLSIQRLSDP